MTKRAVRTLLASSMVAAAGLAGFAATPSFWHTSTRADFARGEVENLSVDSEGRLVLGPALPAVHESAAPFLWSVASAEDGSVFVGSGNDGKVFRLSRDGKSTVFFDAAEMEAHALALGPDGALYVATSPEGRIYKVDRTGASQVFFDPPDKYIWTLALDGAGRLYAGTGDKGVIYRITPDGKGTPFYETRATHVLSLVIDPKGSILAATESPGRLFRIDPAGKPFVLLDTPFREIRSLVALPDGTLYCAAVSRQGSETERPASPIDAPGAQPVPSVSAEITSVAIVDVGIQSSAPTPRQASRTSTPPRGAVYRIDADGTPEVIWESPDDVPYDIAVNGNREIIVGTGSKGRIYSVAAGDPPRVTLVGRVGAQQVTKIVAAGRGESLIVTANPGKVFRLSAERAAEGTFESEVRDAETVSSWGTIRWRASVPQGSAIELRTRSGNSEKPDDTWSAWSEPYTSADGEQVTSPKARFLQWKAVLKGKTATPVLTSVSVAYLQRNLRPRVQSITVHPPGTVFQRPYSTTGEVEIAGFDQPLDTSPPTGQPQGQGQSSGTVTAPLAPMGRRLYHKGLQTFMWSAEDGNGDELRYEVLYRREGDFEWRLLRRDLTEPIMVWDTTAVPNGTYEIKVRASDAPSNVAGSALTGELTSTTFDVDNTPPSIRVLGVRSERSGQVLSVEVQDDQSVIQRVDYSVDAERWRPIYPADGIADSKTERFEIYFEGPSLPAAVVVRATDAMFNVSTAGAPAGKTNGK
ncbi:MAG: hypothetical protein ACE148_12110 [Vicinamibacterales bacterium]